jgi:sulfide:quinone oxidoreductase
VTKSVVVLGAGFAGLELATRLDESLGNEVAVTVIDQSESFVFGFSKLDVLFGRSKVSDVRSYYSEISKENVEFRRESITAIDPPARRVDTDAGSYDADILVVALGTAYDLSATPGFEQGGYEYYSMAGTQALRDALEGFGGGHVHIAVLGEPYKCPPAPFEGALLLHDAFEQRGIRDKVEITVSGYMGAPVPVSEEVSSTIHGALTERNISYIPKTTVTRLDVENKVAETDTGQPISYDFFIGIPVHRVPAVVASSGLAPDGWVPVDRKNLATSFPDVYAVGDVAGLPMAKAGVFAMNAARVVAADIESKIRGSSPPEPYAGAGSCYIEFGGGAVARVEANFLSGPNPTGHIFGPSVEIAREKKAFADEQLKRWFS